MVDPALHASAGRKAKGDWGLRLKLVSNVNQSTCIYIYVPIPYCGGARDVIHTPQLVLDQSCAEMCSCSGVLQRPWAALWGYPCRCCLVILPACPTCDVAPLISVFVNRVFLSANLGFCSSGLTPQLLATTPTRLSVSPLCSWDNVRFAPASIHRPQHCRLRICVDLVRCFWGLLYSLYTDTPKDEQKRFMFLLIWSYFFR